MYFDRLPHQWNILPHDKSITYIMSSRDVWEIENRGDSRDFYFPYISATHDIKDL